MTMPTPDVEREAVDPCPSASQLAGLHAWQHAHAVRCQYGDDEGCGRVGLRFAWWMPQGGHACGRCHARGCALCG